MSANSFNASNLDELDVLLDLRILFLPFFHFWGGWGWGLGAGASDRRRGWSEFLHPAAAARSQGQGQSQWAAANDTSRRASQFMPSKECERRF